VTFLKNQRLLDYRGKDFPDAELIRGIKNRDNVVYEYIYKKYFIRLAKYVVKKRGLNVEDAEDVFQDALVAFWKNTQAPDFKMNCNFVTYFFGICRNKLADHIKTENHISRDTEIIEDSYDDDKDDEINEGRDKNKKKKIILQETNEIFSDLYPLMDFKYLNTTEIKYQLFKKHFFKLMDDCREVLEMASEGIPYDEIAQRMKYTEGTYAKNKKHRCKKYLMDSISKDEMFKHLKK
jgi:RNA polymerase sigma factor (sigma-70 family)